MPSEDTIALNIVSAQQGLFSGKVKSLQVSGDLGELGIFPGHSPLLTKIKPGMVRFINESGQREIIYLSGGILEIQPDSVNILADIAIRAQDLDQQSATEAKQRAQQSLRNPTKEFDYNEACLQLTIAIAQLRVIKQLRKLKGH
jgi:F-type H+-transporting ATPase subunit epsilon